ncbi:prolipoprotein diacylglyceryl transferase family protein [Hymenobacter sp. GOD-10R]|uniref:prolipoprotein diacylglyceryl transferase family protein n=1 Tax=Hymenobacter sp. GOD-10R TaxID=3093922 RepID=UPI002D7704FF|nr:prolipoprotein diacylglyceryl transferase family protein [Hymenobacter sp. GOD-10R]WRQ27011.1 prolipoprotein diacylglyceryl transferase family protein [Hymenobacter sp. GOD-10R]
MSSLLLPSPLGHHYYSLFYLLAFALNQGLLLWEGYRRGYPVRTWLLLMACTTLAFILGTKLIAVPASEWAAWWHTGQWPTSTMRSALGGAVSGTLALLALRRWLGFSWHVFDAFTVPFCVALAVQCVGCLLTGCCFGELAHDGLGLCYAPGTPPFLTQVQQGLIAATASHSLPVQPVQVYQLLVCLAVGATILLVRRKPWPGGSWRLLGLGLLLLGRFWLEFLRDPASERVGATLRPLAGMVLKEVQWVLLPLLFISLFWWLYLIRRHAAARPEIVPVNNSLRNLLGTAALLGITATLGPWALTLPEVLVIKFLLLPVVVIELGRLLLNGSRAATQPRLVGLPLGLASLVLLFTNQTPVDSTYRQSYWSVTGGVGNGRFTRVQEYESTGCGSTPPPPQSFRHEYQSLQLGVAHMGQKKANPSQGTHGYSVEVGLRGMLGRDREYDSIGSLTRTTPLFTFVPYSILNSRYLGVGLGFWIGPLGYSTADKTYSVNKFDAYSLLRLGPRELIYAQGEYNSLEAGLGNPATRFGLGSQFKSNGQVQVLAGLAMGKNYRTPSNSRNQAFFIEASLRPQPNLYVQPYLTLGGREFRQASLRLRYDFRRQK